MCEAGRDSGLERQVEKEEKQRRWSGIHWSIFQKNILCFHWIMFTGQMMFTQKHNVCRLLCSSAERVPIMPLGGHICTRPIIIYPRAAPTKHQTVITIIKTRNSPALHHHHCHKHFERKKQTNPAEIYHTRIILLARLPDPLDDGTSIVGRGTWPDSSLLQHQTVTSNWKPTTAISTIQF